MKNLIVGLGKSGKAAANFLIKLGQEVVGYDEKEVAVSFPLQKKLSYEGIDRVILSPGFDPKKLSRSHVEVIGEMELGLLYAKNPCIGITGTNGKTTTCLMLAHFFAQNDIAARTLGNIGVPITEYLLQPNEKEILILELSSFQLETMFAKSLDMACILNLSPAHLDRYETFAAYKKAKERIRDLVKVGGTFFYGKENVLAAQKIAQKFGCQNFSLKNFAAPDHRITFLGEKNGVTFYNDSKATNVSAVMNAVEKLEGNILLICGGKEQNTSFEPWRKAFKNKVKKIFVIGKSAQKILKQLQSEFVIRKEASLEDAVRNAYASAEANDSILLSPGCSSFDQFRNYEHRGEEFARIVKSILKSGRNYDPS